MHSRRNSPCIARRKIEPAETPIKPDAALIAAGAHDQADRDAGDHLTCECIGGGTVRAPVGCSARRRCHRHKLASPGDQNSSHIASSLPFVQCLSALVRLVGHF
jgi:hypothetical protein